MQALREKGALVLFDILLGKMIAQILEDRGMFEYISEKGEEEVDHQVHLPHHLHPVRSRKRSNKSSNIGK